MIVMCYLLVYICLDIFHILSMIVMIWMMMDDDENDGDGDDDVCYFLVFI